MLYLFGWFFHLLGSHADASAVKDTQVCTFCGAKVGTKMSIRLWFKGALWLLLLWAKKDKGKE